MNPKIVTREITKAVIKQLDALGFPPRSKRGRILKARLVDKVYEEARKPKNIASTLELAEEYGLPAKNNRGISQWLARFTTTSVMAEVFGV